ncbi:MAG: Methyltransferase [Candidatus Tokpelaia hoelldobleri]|uniref:Methyltransferase n=1 Tax=Candidatus Tokpelaia hoelldobleri TaxID=1902579 RepID=A0A1U9JUT5_9HYPH|nr:MAG: Methyltransferase [Candidatus Tokpelaia hoelldoblerii]
MIDEKALEKAYNRGLALEKSGDFAGAAEAYREALVLDPEDHGGAAVRLAAIGQGAVPETAPKAYVATLFDQHAEVFDMILVDQLGYDVPLQLREQLLGFTHGKHIFKQMLDLGCGTGLCADALDDLAESKTGIDLSENMVAIAHEKGDYDKLFVGDVVQFLQEKHLEQWDLIVATDVLPYMGALEAFFTAAAHNLTEEGVFGFSSESLAEKPLQKKGFIVGPHQRFAHDTDYVRQCLEQAGLKLVDCRDIVVRAEQGAPVPGQLFLAKKEN